MSSHREAPGISKDPAADNTDVYAFRNPYRPDVVCIIANFNPFELPYGGPNFSEFADDVTYTIRVSNKGEANADISFLFNFKTEAPPNNTFLYNTGPIGKAPDYKNWTRKQTYSVTQVTKVGNRRVSKVLAKGLAVPPVNVGARSTPDYDNTYTKDAIHSIGGGSAVFAGQRADAFLVDLGSIFDLGGIRPLNENHEIPLQNMPGVNGLSGLNVHTIALQVPITTLAKGGVKPTDPKSPDSVIGVWSSTHRSRSQVYSPKTGTRVPMGDEIQVSRLGNPLFNELLNPMAEKDYWNAMQPHNDSDYTKNVNFPGLAALLPALYPGVFPQLAKFNKENKPRADLNAILMTGIPYGVIKDPNGNKLPYSTYTGSVQADMLRLNLAIAPTMQGDDSYSRYGLLGGDFGGFPNGRRIGDDVTAIELRAIAGATIPLVYPAYKPDDEAGTLQDYSENSYYSNPKAPAGADTSTTAFPFMPAPNSGYATTPLLGSTGGDSGVVGAPDNTGSNDGMNNPNARNNKAKSGKKDKSNH